MNKIYSNQIAKVTMLTEGIRQNAETLRQKEIHLSPAKLETVCEALEKAAREQEAAEAKLKETRDTAHRLLTELKELYNECKSPIKQAFPPERWEKLGIPDKR